MVASCCTGLQFPCRPDNLKRINDLSIAYCARRTKAAQLSPTPRTIVVRNGLMNTDQGLTVTVAQ
jgi:hypothetical protein